MSERGDAAESRAASAGSRGGFRPAAAAEPRHCWTRSEASRTPKGDGGCQEGRRGGARRWREARSRSPSSRTRARSRSVSPVPREPPTTAIQHLSPATPGRRIGRGAADKPREGELASADPGPARSSPARPPSSSRSSRRRQRGVVRPAGGNPAATGRTESPCAGPAPSSKIRREIRADAASVSDAGPVAARRGRRRGAASGWPSTGARTVDARRRRRRGEAGAPYPAGRLLRSPPPPPPRRRRGPRPSRRSPRVPTRAVPVPWTRLSWRLRWRSDSPRWDPSSRRGAGPSRLRARDYLAAAKIDELEASAANRAENSGRTGTTNRGAARSGGREVREHGQAAAALLASEDQPRTSRPSQDEEDASARRRRRAAARLAYLAKRADVHESRRANSSKRGRRRPRRRTRRRWQRRTRGSPTVAAQER